MIRVLYSLDEAINPAVLGGEIRTLGLKDSEDVDKIYDGILKMINPRAKKISDDILKVYGSSKKELINAIKAVLAYNEAVANNDQVKAAEILSPFIRAKDGRLNDSRALKLAKELLEQQTCFSLKDLCVKGNDCIALGFKGKDVGFALQFLLECDIHTLK